MLPQLQKSLITVYDVVKRTGLLDTPPVKRAFVASYFLYKKHLEDPFFKLTKRSPELFRGGHVLDVGANIGYTASIFAQALDDGYRVYAFEPDPENFRMLNDTISQHHFSSKIASIQAAVGKEEGTIAFWHNKAHHGDHRVCTSTFAESGIANDDVTEVPLVSLDALAVQERIESSVAFIKMDVQGYELAVCEGMHNVLDKNPNVAVAIEYMPEAFTALGFDGSKILSFMESRGFKRYMLSSKGEVALCDDEVLSQESSERGYVDLLYSRHFT